MAGPNMDQFEAYFRKADLDGDGRISGAEAVAFFQGANLPKHVLAQIWMHADQTKTGFLGRPEFYNALRLVTVAQSKRDLTLEIVKAALFGSAAAKIPPPKINLPAASASQPNALTGASSSAPSPIPHQMGSVAPQSQNFGFRDPGVSNANFNQSSLPQQNQSMGPPQIMPKNTSSIVAPNVLNSSISNDWLGGRHGAPPTGAKGITSSASPSIARTQPVASALSLPTVNDPKTLLGSRNGFNSTSDFASDLLSIAPSLPKKDSSRSIYSTSSASASLAIVPFSSAPQSSNNNNNVLNSLQDAFSMQPAANQFQRPQAPLNSSQQAAPGSSPFTSTGSSVGVGIATPGNSQLSWPNMKPSDVQKYTKVFMEVDTDRDGRITGEQARHLFLSWRLPREILKQVWNLSDQDNDSMLSLKEFCFALYLMERFKEGRPLPDALPNIVLFDKTLLSLTDQIKASHDNVAWSPGPGTDFGQQRQWMPGPQSMGPNVNLRPTVHGNAPRRDGVQSNEESSRAPNFGELFPDQLDNGHQSSTLSKSVETTTAGKKVEEPKKVILDSKEKTEYYRTKMQELVLYKSRCDNKLNEITERASSNKREAELMGKKYEEKYKHVAEIASKLTIEEATFCDIQARKMELHQAIVKIEQGGSADGILQVRADRIQHDLEELLKALTERCKKYGLHVKSSAIIELPKGWEPGIQEGAAVWDEEWNKFQDEGFVNDITADVSPTSQLASVQREVDGDLENESVFSHNEDDYARSFRDSPFVESPTQEFSDTHYGKGSESDAETHRSFDESTWGAFDNNDDSDSIWGFDASKTNDLESEKHKDAFGSDSFTINPVRTRSPNSESTFQRKSTFIFDDSVPGTPLSRFGNSPRYSEVGDHYFDNFSRFDSFSTHDARFSSQPERLTRFDSINSSKDFGQNSFLRFSTMGSSRDFGQNHERLTRLDSINSTKDFGANGGGAFSFDDTDPFGSSGPFKVSSPKKSSDR
ncbi:uncharacterized protein LOC115695742 isoform X2 [Cannabis sativa]|uniref:Uncharacterized protein n=2 Tax=Cannabis sativa TaxID=3483 RepID=A0A803QBB2_CANSA|nr:uncharacterized protein LOC115695742 isoform X2 [Cannabis sativa]XP_060973098.1 uncharacterized protein LOC115695742 isoform X2 [Cannabis sativa]